MADTIDHLQIKVDVDNEGALSKLTKLATTLMKLQSLASKLTGIHIDVDVPQIDAFTASLQNLSSVASSTEFQTALANLRELSRMKFTNFGKAMEQMANTYTGAVAKDLSLTPSPVHSMGAANKIYDIGYDPNYNKTLELEGTFDFIDVEPIEEAKESLSEVGAEINEVAEKSKEAKDEVKNMGKSLKDLDKHLKTSSKSLGAWSSFLGMVKRMIVRMAIRAVINNIVKAVQEGTKNLYAYSDLIGGKFASSMDRLTSSNLYLKNSFAAMVSPIVNAVTPAIDYLIDKIVQLLNVLNMAFSFMSGSSTWTKATKQATKFGGAIGGAGGAAKELQKILLSFDELHLLNDPTSGGGGGGSGSAGDIGTMFEEMAIPDAFVSKMEELADKFTPVVDRVKEFASVMKEQASQYDWVDTLVGAWDHLTDLIATSSGIAVNFFATVAENAHVFDTIHAAIELISTSAESLNILLEKLEPAFSKISEFAGKVMDKVSESGVKNIERLTMLSERMGEFFEKNGVYISRILEDIVDVGSKLWDALSPIFAKLGELAWDKIIANLNAILNIWSALLPILTVAADVLNLVFNALLACGEAMVKFLSGDTKGAFESLKKNSEDIRVSYQNLQTDIKNVGVAYTDMWNNATTVSKSANETIAKSSLTALDNISSATKKTGSDVSSTWSLMQTDVAQRAREMEYNGTNTAEKIRKAWNVASSDVVTAWSSVPTLINSNVFQSIGNEGSKAANRISDAFASAKTSILNSFASLGSSLPGQVRGGINSVISGVERMINSSATGINALIRVANGIVTKAGGRGVALVSSVSLPRFASGGFPEDGLFMANRGELVGQFSNGKTAVANNEQIIEGIEQGVYRAMTSAMGTGENNISVSVDGERLFSIMVNRNNEVVRQTGQTPLLV